MKVLFIGGTGVISAACSQLAIQRGLELYLLNRGQTAWPPDLAGAHGIVADVNDTRAVKAALGSMQFDAVVDWIAYTPDQVERDLELFKGCTGQYVFISSASAYQKPVLSLPITESMPLRNPFWAYSRDKIACEERLMRAYRQEEFPVTIVRPSHTYDHTRLPFRGRYTVVDRMRKGKPVIVHGDGSSLWVLTHQRDFAKGFVPLLGHPAAIGEAFHITSDEVLTWDQIYSIVGRAAGVPDPQIVHIPSEMINAYDPVWGEGLLGDKTHSVIFDNTKIKRIVPEYSAGISFRHGAEEMMAWFDAHESARQVDEAWNALFDRIIAAYRSAWPA